MGEFSKPLQAHRLQEHGFSIPPSLSTSVPEDYRSFREGKELIYKSNSAERSIVDRVDRVEADRLAFLPACPVLFQHLIRGRDVRVHVIGGAAFPVLIESDAVDYRYAKRQGAVARMQPLRDLPAEIRDRCPAFSRSCGLDLAGFDFKITPEDRWYCLEMNPAPGFEGYDRVLGGTIARRLLEHLSGKKGKMGALPLPMSHPSHPG
jgi:hypothetical protein